MDIIETCVDTFQATIYVGLRIRSENRDLAFDLLEGIVYDYVNRVECCVTVTPTKFFYVGGWEPGAAIGFINYPRFPAAHDVIEEKALGLAKHLLVKLRQCRISVVLPQQTIMLSNLAEMNLGGKEHIRPVETADEEDLNDGLD